MKAFRWLGVELRHLAALHAVAAEGSFARGARRLGYTQPAVSQQIATLERIVGERLIERSNGSRQLALTDAGRVLLAHAETIVAQLQAAEADLAARGGHGLLRVGTFQSAGNRIVPTLLRRFRERFPETRVELAERASPEELLALIENGRVELAFVVLPVGDGPFVARHLVTDPYVLAVSRRSSLASRESPVRLDRLGDLPLVGLGHAQPYPDGFALAKELERRAVYTAVDNSTLLGLVREGLGAALVPRLMLDPGDAEIVQVPLAEPVPSRTIGLVSHRDRLPTAAAQTFAELASTVAARVSAALDAAWDARLRRAS
jgi:molybdate transport repressor ModE-like protein